jgi:hypothetical protein
MEDAVNEVGQRHQLEVFRTERCLANGTPGDVASEHATEKASPRHAINTIRRCHEALLYLRLQDYLSTPFAMGGKDSKIATLMGIGRTVSIVSSARTFKDLGGGA